MEEMEEIYFRMHAQLLQWFQRLLSAKVLVCVCTYTISVYNHTHTRSLSRLSCAQVQSRLRIEVLLFVVASHLLLLCCLLHGSFVGDGHGDCLAQYFPVPPAAQYSTENNSRSRNSEPRVYNPRLVLRIQVRMCNITCCDDSINVLTLAY